MTWPSFMRTKHSPYVYHYLNIKSILTDISPKNVFNLLLVVFSFDNELIITIHRPAIKRSINFKSKDLLYMYDIRNYLPYIHFFLACCKICEKGKMCNIFYLQQKFFRCKKFLIHCTV